MMNSVIISQELLVNQLRCIFPDVHTHTNVKKKTNIVHPISGSYLELDVWYPNFNLAFEFQDTYHYTTTWYSQTTRERIQKKDMVKKNMALERGLSLIHVPCWWDGTVESLSSTIHFYRPDLLPASDVPFITLNPPAGFLDPVMIPHVGELMLASFPFDSKFSIPLEENNTWWMGEKYDGIRFCWNPVHEVAYSRGGNEFLLPQTIAILLPSSFIDGEFWFGRGLYGYTYSLFKGSPDLVLWDHFRMIAFDIPNIELHKLPYEDRYSPLFFSIPFDHPYTIIATRILVKNDKQLSTAIQELIDEEGEGVILQKVNSPYVHGRTPNLIKLKTAHADMEGIVVSVAKDRSVELKIPSGTIFRVPPQSVQITTPQIGQIVTFTYESNVRRDVPSSPRIIRIRNDVNWDEVVENSKKEKKYLNENFKVEGYKTKSAGHWTTANMRRFMENFARSSNLDPSDPNTWTSSSTSSSILKTKEGSSIFQKYKGFSNTVRNLFPDLDFEGKTFAHSSWNDIQMRRKFFEDYAKNNDFDPLIRENWYDQPIDLIASAKGSASLIYHHKTLSQALIDLFPDIGIDPDALNWDRSIWVDEASRRKFFLNFANTNKFDPYVADNWYTVPRDQIMFAKGASKVKFYHNGSISQALVDLFPDIGLDKNKLWVSLFSWRKTANRRQFFIEHARSHSFDPLIASNWYKAHPETIMSTKNASRVMSFHHNSVQQALLDLFPNIGLDKCKFPKQVMLREEKQRREILERYAKEKGFDPRNSEAWYTQSKQKILSWPGVPSLISYHKGSLVQAMFDLFPNIGLVKANLWTKRLWRDKARRRKFFESYAKAKAFNPLIPNNWYSQSVKNILTLEGAHGVIHFHGRSVQQALLDLFPEIGLEKAKFPALPEYDKFENRRKFFLDFAKENEFDPHNANNWYSQSRHKLVSTKGLFSVISYHGNKVAIALHDLFPDINFDPSKVAF